MADPALHDVSSLDRIDPDLARLLSGRRALVESLRGPIRLAQARLAKQAEAGVNGTDPAQPAADNTADLLDASGRRLEEGLAALAKAEGDFKARADEDAAILKQGGLKSSDGVKGRLALLQKKGLGGLPRDELSTLAPEPARDLARVEREIGRASATDRTLSAELSRFFIGLLDGIVGMFSATSTRKHKLGVVRAELDSLRSQREEVSDRAAAEAAAALASLGEQRRREEAGRRRAMAGADGARRAAREAAALAGGHLHSTLRTYCAARKAELNAVADRIAKYLVTNWPPAAVAAWDADVWDRWPEPDASGRPKLKPFAGSFLRVGEVREQTRNVLSAVAAGPALEWLASGARSVSVPVVAPFIGRGRALVVACGQREEAGALSVVHAMTLRIAATMGRQAGFRLLDPTGYGQAFPMQRALGAPRGAEDVNADLREVELDVRRVNAEILDGQGGLHELDDRRLASESFVFVVAAGFPKGYDRRAVETLFRLAAAGPRAGRYVVLQYTLDHPLPRDIEINQLENRLVLDPDRLFTPPENHTFQRDELPAPGRRQDILDRINSAARTDHSLAWDDLVGLGDEGLWWQAKSDLCVTTPIGLRGASDAAEVWFGVRQDRTCVHGMLAAMPGAGKSTLYHVLILGLAVRYPCEELRLYLIDGKKGVEFRPYEALPHAEVVSLKSQPERSRSVLEELSREMDRRYALFRRNEVEDFTRYRQKAGGGGKPLHRILLLIDEYRDLFEDDRDGLASTLLGRLAEQGRGAGIHMFLGAHQFGAPEMLHQKTILGNVHLKMAMKMQPDDIMGLTEFGPNGKRMIRDCDVAGKFVLNVTGRDEESVPGKAAYLDPDRRTALIARLREMADRTPSPPAPPIVFKGDTAPPLMQNPALRAALWRQGPWVPKELESAARREEGPEGGFGQGGWVAADKPVGLWLGRRFNVHGHAMAALRRGVDQHLLIVGASAEARAGMLAGLVASVVALHRPEELAVTALHAGADDEDPTVRVLEDGFARWLRPAGFDAALWRDGDRAAALVDEAAAELERRRPLPSRDLPGRLILLLEPDRMAPLRQSGGAGRAGNPNYEKLRRLLAEGSQHGVHVVMVASALRLLGQALDERRDLAHFSHRVALQMNEDDSFTLFRSRKAAQLQPDSGSPPCALYVNVESNTAARFEPYAAELGPLPEPRAAGAAAGAAVAG